MKELAWSKTGYWFVPALTGLLLSVSCGRTPLLDPVCSLTVSSASLDFGEIEVGRQADLKVTLTSGSGSVCHVSLPGLTADSDATFALAERTPTELTLHSNDQVTVHVTFNPTEVTVPLQRSGALIVTSDDPSRSRVDVPLTGKIHSDCRLAIMPTTIDLGRVPLGDSAAGTVHVMNTGSTFCDIGQIALAPGSDPQFTVNGTRFLLAPGTEGTITPRITARDSTLPHHRTGQLTFATTDANQANVSIPLSADIVVCSLAIDPNALDFGEVAPGSPVTLSLNVNTSKEGAICTISSISLRPDSDAGFAVGPDLPVGMGLAPGTQIAVATTFNPARVQLPLPRKGTLVLATNDPLHPTIEVPLSARIRSECRLTVAPESLNFGQVMLESTATGTVRIINGGKGPCEITDMALARESDKQFALGPRESEDFTIEANSERVVTLTFHAVDPAEPHRRTGRLVFTSTDPQRETIGVPLSADIDLGCVINVAPVSVDFGNVILNTTNNASVALVNQGTQPCQISSIAMKPGSDSGFALGASQPNRLFVGVGEKQTVALRFDALDSSPPHEKKATLLIDSNDRKRPQIAIPLAANIDTVCVEASRWIYTVDQDTTLSRFDPSKTTFTDIAKINCASMGSHPFSMAVDQKAVAWVLYNDGRLFKVDTATAKCESTGFQDSTFVQFGMGFMFNPANNTDTLYIAGGPSMSAGCTLATIDFPSLKVTKLGQIKEGWPELSGTGDGSLWGFYPAQSNYQAALVRLDPANGNTLETYYYSNVTGGGSWAMKFWGGQFWLFLGNSIYAVDRDQPKIAKTIKTNTGRNIVGAGVSTCAPLKGN